MRRDPSLIPLSHDHHHALALCVLTTRGLAAEDPANLARNIVEYYEREMRRHFAVEERILFPALDEHARALIAELLSEHRRMEQMIESLRSGHEHALIEEFCKLLQQHVRSEENHLFETAQRLLTRDQLDELGRKLSSSD